jgi:hypothetical protein
MSTVPASPVRRRLAAADAGRALGDVAQRKSVGLADRKPRGQNPSSHQQDAAGITALTGGMEFEVWS